MSPSITKNGPPAVDAAFCRCHPKSPFPLRPATGVDDSSTTTLTNCALETVNQRVQNAHLDQPDRLAKTLSKATLHNQ